MTERRAKIQRKTSETSIRVELNIDGKDPAWKAAREASEKAAGGSLTVNGGVKSVFLVPTDYSPTR
jgi:imidazoleglycerol phosphate dehydratase HisB